MAEELLPIGAILRHRRQANLITDAKVVASYTESPERTHHAELLIREAMLMRTLGNIDRATQFRVFSILAFAMPDADATVPSS